MSQPPRPKFTLSLYCTSRKFCDRCRNMDGGKVWRDIMRQTHETPAGPQATEWECPHGLPWGESTPAPKCRCGNCGGEHATDRCPIPRNFDGNYQLDSRGTPPCGC